MYHDTGMQGVLSVFCCTVVVCMVVSLIAVMPRVAYARSGEKVAAQEMININTATKDELLVLKRVGPSLAGRIIAYREEHGPFQRTQDILNVKGLGEKFWEANDYLFQHAHDPGPFEVSAMASAIGVAESALKECLQSRAAQLLEGDLREGLSLKITGTPTFRVNGKIYMGKLPIDALAPFKVPPGAASAAPE